MHYGVTQEEAVGDYGGCCGTGDGRDRTRATSFITELTRGAVIRVPLSRLVSRAAPLSFRLSPPSLTRSPFLRLFLSSRFRLFALTLPPPSLPPLAVCLSLGYSLLFANSGSDYRRFTLDRQPSFYLSALASL